LSRATDRSGQGRSVPEPRIGSPYAGGAAAYPVVVDPRGLAAGLMLACALSGCSDAGVMGGPGEPDASASREFSPRKVDLALLTEDDLGGPFQQATDEDHEFDSGVDSYDARFGCLTALDVLDNKANDPADAAHEYDTGSDDEVADVLTAVISYRSAAVAEAAMDDLDRGLTRCKPVDHTDDDGTRWQMDPRSDTAVRADGGDRQTTVIGVGTFSDGPADINGSLAVVGTAVRVENNVVIVVMIDLTDDLGDAPHDVTQAAVDRLAAVTAGEDPPAPAEVLDDYAPGGGVDA
jgi:hypothetical protein